VDRVRKRISPLKINSDEWLEVMQVAHELGLKSSATMMFGHVETIEDRVEHLQRIRDQQDSQRRIHALFAGPFSRNNTVLKVKAAHWRVRISANASARTDFPGQHR
jgi:cyclic dehypoxanthinyl futalosine synthase